MSFSAKSKKSPRFYRDEIFSTPIISFDRLDAFLFFRVFFILGNSGKKGKFYQARLTADGQPLFPGECATKTPGRNWSSRSFFSQTECHKIPMELASHSTSGGKACSNGSKAENQQRRRFRSGCLFTSIEVHANQHRQTGRIVYSSTIS